MGEKKIVEMVFSSEDTISVLRFRADIPVGAKIVGGRVNVSTRGSSIACDVLVDTGKTGEPHHAVLLVAGRGHAVTEERVQFVCAVSSDFFGDLHEQMYLFYEVNADA
jgi:hypothetical protein